MEEDKLEAQEAYHTYAKPLYIEADLQREDPSCPQVNNLFKNNVPQMSRQLYRSILYYFAA
jgi:hypothetical protein